MRYLAAGLVVACAASWALAAGAAATRPATRPAAPLAEKPVAWVVVLDFHTIVGAKAVQDDPAVPLAKRTHGVQLADSIRGRLRRHAAAFKVIDRLTTRDFAGTTPVATARKTVAALMRDRIGANVGLYGTVQVTGKAVRAEVVCVDLRDGAKGGGWTKVFTDDSERARGVIALRIVEAVTGRAEWIPPQYGDEPEPRKFGPPLNVNGNFQKGHAGWDPPDNVSTFLIKAPKRGTVLRVRTDLRRDPWLAYRRALRLGKATPAKPPKIARDTSYGSVAGLEGVHYRSAWIKATPGHRYWLTVDHKGLGGAKVFLKGFRATPAGQDGMPESSLAELGLTPEQFAKLPRKRQGELIAADAKKNPKRHLRECYRWFLNCKEAKGQWRHLAAPVPPRGGLPKDVQWLQIQIYSYWPPGEYLWDNCFLYKDPTQKAPLPEQKARTPEFDRRRKINEDEIRQGGSPGAPKTRPARPGGPVENP